MDNFSLTSAQISDLRHFAGEKKGSSNRGTGSSGLQGFIVDVKNVFEEAYQKHCYSLSFAVSGLNYVTTGSRYVARKFFKF